MYFLLHSRTFGLRIDDGELTDDKYRNTNGPPIANNSGASKSDDTMVNITVIILSTE